MSGPSHTPLAVSNPRVKEARKLSRRSVRAERRLFLADGPKAVEGALSARCVEEVFATATAADQYAERLGPEVTLVDERAMAALSDSVTPAGVVAVCRFLAEPGPIAPGDRLVVLAADVRDPGNAGTLIRTSDAGGVDSVRLVGDSVDRYNPKTIRASVGSLFHLPVGVEPDPSAAIAAARGAGLTVLATAGDGEVDLFEADELLARPTAWLFGNEAHGLPPELAEQADHRVRIPMRGGAESLNLSTAAAVCLFASAREQRAVGQDD